MPRDAKRLGLLKFEQEFFKLAGTVLACHLRAMGGVALISGVPAGDLAFSLLGIVDYCGEMRLLCQEVMGKRPPLAVWHPAGRPTVEKSVREDPPALTKRVDAFIMRL